MYIVLILLVVLIFIKGQSALYSRNWEKGLAVQVKFSDRLVEEDEAFQVIETVENRKRLPLPSLTVKFSTSSGLDVSGLIRDENANISDKFYYSDVVPAMGNRHITRKIKCAARKRGVYSIDEVFLSCENLLISEDMHDIRSNEANLLVYPGHLNRFGFSLPFRTLIGDIVTRFNLIEDPFEFRGIREYAPGDSMNRINWKASARTEEYVVNQFHQTIAKSAVIAVNCSQPTARFEDMLLEESFRLMVSAAEELLKLGFSVKVISNGRNIFTGEETVVGNGRTLRHMEVIHEAAAAIDALSGVTDYVSSDICRQTFETEDFLIFISFSQEEALIKRFAERAENGYAGYWIVPVNHNVKYTLPESLRNLSGEWSVHAGR